MSVWVRLSFAFTFVQGERAELHEFIMKLLLNSIWSFGIKILSLT